MFFNKKPKKQYNDKKKLGKVHVYTGDGKGKTTAALGLLLRALGHDHKVLMIRFMGGHKDAGEIKALKKLQKTEVEILPFATEESVDLEDPKPIDRHLAYQGLYHARKVMKTNRPDLLILDEINPVIHHGLLDLSELINFLDHRHRQTEIVLTGRNAHPEILNYADLVTIMNATKNYFDSEDYEPRLGIEH